MLRIFPTDVGSSNSIDIMKFSAFGLRLTHSVFSSTATYNTVKMFQIFIDSDGPMCDFDKALSKSNLQTDEFKHLPGLYLWLDETLGSRSAIEELKAYDDEDIFRIWILTKTPSRSPYAYTEKVLWYREHYPWLEDRIILSHDKSLLGCKDDFLLDDRPHKANAKDFRGTFVKFDVQDPRTSWELFTKQVLTFAENFYAENT